MTDTTAASASAPMKRFGFGCMRLPVTDENDQTTFDMPQIEQMVDEFLAAGFTYFDTAYIYHGREGENAVRRALVERHPREAFVLADKLPTMSLKEEGDQERIFEEQLAKCGVEYFDYYLLHHLGGLFYKNAAKFDSFSFIRRLKEEGKVRNIGFSYHHDPAFLDQLLTEHPEVDFVQLQINYLDWEDPAVQSRACWEVARKHGKPIVVMEPVKGGGLSQLPPEAVELLREADPDASPASWALRFAAGVEGVMMVLSGMSTIDQLHDNVATMGDFKPLTDDEHALLRAVADIVHNQTVVPCTACRYCVDSCPKGIAIPEYFALLNADKRMVSQGFSTQRIFYRNLMNAHGKASECIGCRRCERMCPQGIHIPEELKKVVAAFEG